MTSKRKVSANAVPSNAEIAGEKDPTRKDILAAMQRMLSGRPKHVALGAHSVTHLAIEAGVGRHHLYQAHRDLRDRFEFIRDRTNELTEKEANLKKLLERSQLEVQRARELQARTRREADNWKALSELTARAINVLQEELHQEQLKAGRLAKRLREAETRAAHSAPVVLMHRRHDNEL